MPLPARPPDPTPRRILAVRLDNTGDVLMLGPALRAVRHAHPAARITLLASPTGAGAAPLLPWIDDVRTTTALWQDADGRLPFDPDRELALVAELAATEADWALLFTSFSQTPHAAGYACYLAGIPVRVGESKEFGGAVLTHAVPPSGDDVHQVERNLRLVDAVGVARAGDHLEVALPAGAREAADGVLAEAGLGLGQPFVLLAPGATAEARRYPRNLAVDAAAAVVRSTDLPVIVAGSPRDADECDELALAAGPGVLSIGGRTDLATFAAVVDRAELVIANNSGPLHLADARGRPLVLLYSGTDLVSQWRPRRSASRLLRRRTDCTPCYRFTCPIGRACLDIPGEEVADAVVALLADDRRSNPETAAASRRSGGAGDLAKAGGRR